MLSVLKVLMAGPSPLLSHHTPCPHSARRLSQSENCLCLVAYAGVVLDAYHMQEPAYHLLPTATVKQPMSAKEYKV